VRVTQSDIAKRNKAFDEKYSDERYCRGCGSYIKPLSRAHILRVSQYKELQLDIENMRYLCLSVGGKGCHEIWDDGTNEDRRKLKCYDEFMAFIKEKDELLYNRLNN
jgi:hypothetical protein